MIKVLSFKRCTVKFTTVTKDTPDLEKYGVSLREIAPVACQDGLALQKCDARLYALIHVPSGHTIQMRSLRADQAHHWFSTALSVMSWDVSMETIMADHRIKEVLELGKMLEDAFYFPPERETAS
jgi:hypothetical protein